MLFLFLERGGGRKLDWLMGKRSPLTAAVNGFMNGEAWAVYNDVVGWADSRGSLFVGARKKGHLSGKG